MQGRPPPRVYARLNPKQGEPFCSVIAPGRGPAGVHELLPVCVSHSPQANSGTQVEGVVLRGPGQAGEGDQNAFLDTLICNHRHQCSKRFLECRRLVGGSSDRREVSIQEAGQLVGSSPKPGVLESGGGSLPNA